MFIKFSKENTPGVLLPSLQKMEYIFARRFSEISNTAALGTLTGGERSMSSSWWGQRMGFCGSKGAEKKKNSSGSNLALLNVILPDRNKALTRRLTCNHSLEVPADAQLLLLVVPQLQQDSGSRLTVAVTPLEDVRQSVGVVAQLEQDGQDDGIDAAKVRLSNGEAQDGYFHECMMQRKMSHLQVMCQRHTLSSSNRRNTPPLAKK